jgi:hypothetical protein
MKKELVIALTILKIIKNGMKKRPKVKFQKIFVISISSALLMVLYILLMVKIFNS